MPAWTDLAPEDQAVAARFMECFAAYLSYTDAQLGRVLEYLEETGDLDNTLIMLLSDNGASAEGGARGSINDARLWNGAVTGRRELRARIDELGGPEVHNNYPWGWTMAGNTPFKRWKREVHEGGVADPCIVRLPRRAGTQPATGIRHQFAHAIDVLPTVLELAGIEAPSAIDGIAQSPVDGTSFLYALTEADAPEQHDTQYFEMLGSRAIYHRGWKAVTFHALGNMYDDGLDADAPFDDDVWELYHVAEDLSETRDLAAKEPDRLAEMIDLWWAEARRNDVLPLDNRPLHAILNPRPRRRGSRHRYVYRAHGAPVPETSAVHLPNRPHVITADVEIPTGTVAEGILLAMGSALGGFAFYLRDGRLRYVHNLYGKERQVVSSDETIAPGVHALAYEFTKTKGFAGVGRLTVDGHVVGEGDIPHFTPMQFSNTGGGLTCGYEVGPAVGDDYVAPFRCNVPIAPRRRRGRRRARARPDGGLPSDHVRAIGMAKLARLLVVGVLGAAPAPGCAAGPRPSRRRADHRVSRRHHDPARRHAADPREHHVRLRRHAASRHPPRSRRAGALRRQARSALRRQRAERHDRPRDVEHRAGERAGAVSRAPHRRSRRDGHGRAPLSARVQRQGCAPRVRRP